MSDETASADTSAVEPEGGAVEVSESEEATETLIADPVLLAARNQARDALTEITDAEMIGAEAGYEVQGEHLLTLFFESCLPGYPGWRWAATLARVDEESAVNVLEVEMLPGEGAVVAPEWVPWSERLAHYRETQSKLAADEAALAEAVASELEDDDEVDSDDDILDDDFSDFDDEIHGADVEDFEDTDREDADDDDDSAADDDESEEDGDE